MHERVGEIKERVARLAKRGKENIKRVASIAGVAGAVALVAAGCGKETHTLKEAKVVAAKKYQHSYGSASPAGKYLLQYLRVAHADVVKHKTDPPNSYIDKYYRFDFNNSCLGGTAYDVAGGHFTATAEADGFFSSASAEVEGEVPSAAANAIVDSDNPDILTVRSGHPNTPPIRFSGVEGNDPLNPLGKQTHDVLSTYGCELGMLGYTAIEGIPETGTALPTVYVK